ncbi:MAG: glycosyltransferase [Lentisphaeria bacterium]|jgi:glycosyltransferase involved in cell wall biosynthesis
MNILQLITELNPGGAERVVVNLSRELQAQGHTVRVCCLRPPPLSSPIVEELQQAGIPVFSLGLGYLQPWRLLFFRHLLQHMRRLHGRGETEEFIPDLIHAHLFHAGLVATSARHPAEPWKLVYTVHICERRKRRFWQFLLERRIARRADAVTGVSQAVRRFYAARTGLDPARIHLTPNGIHPPNPCPPERRQALRSKWGVADCTRVIGAAARLDWQKGLDLLLAALHPLAAKLPPGERWGVVILGEGPHRRRLERLAASAPPAFKVVLPGFRADAPDCLGAFDLFAMPSRYEGFGLTLSEAMAHGIPILANDSDSLPEVLAGYPNGRILPIRPRQLEPWADACLELARRDLRTPQPPMTVREMTARHAELYASLLARPPAAPAGG